MCLTYTLPSLTCCGADGCSVGLTLEGASLEELTELDRLLTLMADMRTPETEREGERDREREEREKERGRERGRERKEGAKPTREKEDEKPTWGTTIAGVSVLLC